MNIFNETTLEKTALDWFESFGWQATFGPDISPDGPACERQDYEQSDATREVHDKVWLFDLEDLENNDWLTVNQFTVIEDRKNRRPDIVIFVNGLMQAIARVNRMMRTSIPKSVGCEKEDTLSAQLHILPVQETEP